MNICVYCASSNAVAPAYFAAAQRLGRRIAQRGDTLVYGGADVGLMGALAQAVKEGGGRVVGIMPELIAAERISFRDADEFIVTRDMRERKARMAALADAFFVLPGGFGTLEELAEMLVLRQLREHTKPIVLLNIQGFYEPLIALFEHYYHEGFAKPWRELYHVSDSVEGALEYLDAYIPVAAPSKWLGPERDDG
jgi:cytokinin riboside 5'-monophosphate phosphoribohydrolase